MELIQFLFLNKGCCFYGKFSRRQYIVNIGPNLARNIPDSNLPFHSFLRGNIPNSLFFLPTHGTEVIDIVNNFKLKNSSGYGGITNVLFKKIIHVIVSPLTHICNRSLTTGTVPNKMNIAKVIPIFKKGNQQDVGNYHPISLLTIFSKILEKIVYSRLITFLNCNHVLSGSQFGFRKKH